MEEERGKREEKHDTEPGAGAGAAGGGAAAAAAADDDANAADDADDDADDADDDADADDADAAAPRVRPDTVAGPSRIAVRVRQNHPCTERPDRVESTEARAGA